MMIVLVVLLCYTTITASVFFEFLSSVALHNIDCTVNANGSFILIDDTVAFSFSDSV